MNKRIRILLIVIALVCFGVALYYPISEYMQKQQNMSDMDDLRAIMEAGRQRAAATEAPTDAAAPEETAVPGADTPATDRPAETAASATEAPAAETGKPGNGASATAAPANEPTASGNEPTEPASFGTVSTQAAQPVTTPITEGTGEQAPEANGASATDALTVRPDDGATPSPTPAPTASPSPSPTPDRRVNNGVKIWADVEKIALDESKILPQYQDLYAMNNDMVGWLTVQNSFRYGAQIDYPVMQTEDDTYYLDKDFMRRENKNGMLILDSHCDPYTPSYNLVVSGHNRWNDTMFSNLYSYYNNKRNWQAHKFVQFDSLMEERTYVVFAAFFSADYDEDEEGFRYNADIQYSVDMNIWLTEVDKYKLYDTGIDVKFGDQILTLTTCNSSKRKNGRFVVVCRRVREGEEFE